jgi:hypothetical protein
MQHIKSRYELKFSLISHGSAITNSNTLQISPFLQWSIDIKHYFDFVTLPNVLFCYSKQLY